MLSVLVAAVLTVLGTSMPVLAGDAAQAGEPTTGTVAGVVTDSVTHLPVAGAVVASDLGGAAVAMTDAAGRWTLEVDPGPVSFEVTADGYEPAPVLDTSGPEPTPVIQVVAGETTSGLDVALDPWASLAGRATDGSGEGVEGVVVALYRSDDPTTVLTDATTGADGSWLLDEVPAGSVRLHLDASDTPFLSAWWKDAATFDDATTLSVAAGSSEVVGSQELVRGATVAGTVRDDAGDPVAGVGVEVREENGGPAGWALSEPDGSYLVRGLQAGQYTIGVAQAPWVALSYGQRRSADPVQYFSVPEAADVAGKNLDLVRGATIRGRVTVEDGRPDVQPWVNVQPPHSSRQVGYVSFDDTGYRVEGLETGSYTLQFSARVDGVTYRSEYWEDVTDPEAATAVDVVNGETVADIDAELAVEGDEPTRPANITGIVRDSVSGARVPGAFVTARCFSPEGADSVSAVSGDDGRFHLAVVEGSCGIEVDDPDGGHVSRTWVGADGEATVTTSADAVVDLGHVDLEPGAVVSGRVTAQSDGSGVGDVEILVQSVDPTRGYLPYNTTTQADGSFSLTGLPADVYRVVAVPPATSPYTRQWWVDSDRVTRSSVLTLTTGASRTDVDIALFRGASLSGRVVDPAGDPVAGMSVSAQREGIRGGLRVTSDDAGAFTIGDLPPGRWTLVADGSALGYETTWLGGATRAVDATYVDIAAGQAVSGRSVTVQRHARIVGTVTDPGGRAVAGAQVTAEGPDYGWAETDASGRYTVDGLAAGDYRVRVDGPEGSELVSEYVGGARTEDDAAPLTVVRSGTVTANVSLDLGGGVAGTVRGPNGVPVASAWVSLTGVDGQPAGDTSTGPDGTFRVGGLLAGSYRVMADGPELGARYFPAADDASSGSLVPVVAGQTRAGTDIALATGATISGTFTDAEGGPEPQALVLAWSVEEQRFVDVDVTEDDGVFRLSGLEPGRYAVGGRTTGRVSVWSTSARAWWESTLMPLTTGQDVTGVRLAAPVPPPGGVVTGRVVVPTGTSAADGTIEARSTTTRRSVPVAADGSFRLEDLPPGSYELIASVPDESVGRASQTVSVPRTTPVEIALPRAGVLTGSVVNGAGRGLPDAHVAVVDAFGAVDAQVGADGRWMARGVTPGDVTVRASGEGYAPTWSGGGGPASATRYTVTEGTTVSVPPLVMPVAGAVSGTVRLPLSAQAWAVVEVSTPGGDLVGSTWVEVASSTYLVDGLPPGTYVVSFEGPDLGSQWWRGATTRTDATPVVVEEGRETEKIDAVLALAPGSDPGQSGTATVSGSVQLPAGPMRRGWVHLVPVSGGEDAYAQIDDGLFRVQHVVAGTYRVVARQVIVYLEEQGDMTDSLYWPGTTDPLAAQLLTVADGAVVTGIELAGGLEQFTASPVPTVQGSANVGSTLNAVTGTWTPMPSFGYEWLVDGVVVPGATGSTYLVRNADATGRISVRVRGTRDGYAPLVRESARTLPVTGGIVVGSVPIVSGTPTVGKTLTAVPGTWGPGAVALGYQWSVAGAPVAGATAATFTLPGVALGKTVTVTVTGTRTGFATQTRTSVATATVAAAALTSTPTPTVSGTARVGSRLTATTATWGPAPVTLAYQWLRSGSSIPGATTSGYTLTAADLGRQMTVRVTGSKLGYASVARTSTPTASVAAGILTATPVPTVSGTAKVGRRLTASTGTWGPAPVTLSFQWFRSGSPIAGATTSAYTLTAADHTKRMTVRVTGRRAGYTTVSRTSAATATVAAGTLTPTPTPTISGTLRRGATLKATAGTWGPGTVSLSYRWYRNGSAISGATSSSYVLTIADKGTRITVRVTGRKTGYTTVTRTSTATGVVP